MNANPEKTKQLGSTVWNKFQTTTCTILLLCLAAFNGPAQSYTVVHAFGTNTMGVTPQGALLQGPDGTLYGTTESGGAANAGQVFKVNPDGSGYAGLYNFTATDPNTGTNSDGANPLGGLVLSGNTLYGTTANGGINGCGTVFAVNTDGSGFAVLHQFSGWPTEGASPDGRLTLYGTTLYGATSSGGAFWFGTVFKLNTDGSGFAVLKHFTGYDGSYPNGGLVLSGTTLYGTASEGSANNAGVVFKVNTDGARFTVLKSFFPPTDGSQPYAGLLLTGQTLYGVASSDGASGCGTIFKLNTDGSNFSVLFSFDGGSDPSNPFGGLVLSGDTLYGTTSYGGPSGSGGLFGISTNGSDFTILYDFTGGNDGSGPSTDLILSGNTLYGTAGSGGNFGYGTLFKLQTDGSAFAVVTHFAGGDGANPGPAADLVLADAIFYGTTAQGGAYGNGAVFSLNADGSNYRILHSFTALTLLGVYTTYTTNADGAGPAAGLVVSGTTLYGTAASGGEFGDGTVFSMDLTGTGFRVLKTFSGDDGANPYGTLVLSGSTLYGTTEVGGASGVGTIFAVNTDGSDFTVLKKFNGGDGAYPVAGLILSGNTLYGTTQGGGASEQGTVFAINTDGSGFTNLYNFQDECMNPAGGLILSGNTLYGTASSGGTYDYGAVFALNTDGSGFTVLKSFGGSDGADPDADLLLSGTTLYGTTSQGGNLWHGTVFEVNTDGSGFAVIRHFDGSDGDSPQAGLVLSGTTLYGTAPGGGSANGGVLFGVSLIPGAPEIQLQPQGQICASSYSATFTALAGGIPAPAYQWFFYGNAIDGATNYDLELDNLQDAQAGDYTVVITNSYGSVTSQVASLTVQDPYITGSPNSEFVNAGDTVQFSVYAVGNEDLSYQWIKDGVTLVDGGNVSGSQTATLTLSNVLASDEGWYSAAVSSADSSIVSLPAFLLVQDPCIRLQPWSQSVHLGESVQFSVSAQGTGLNYQWQKNGSNLNDGETVLGTQTPTLTLSNVSMTDAGGYSVTVSNSYGSIASSLAGLAVGPPGDYSILHSFTGDDLNSDGSYPHGELTVSGSMLYGTTYNGGANGVGTVFALDFNRENYQVVHSLSSAVGPDAQGFSPEGKLVLSGSTLYGAANEGGEYGCGTIFMVNSDGTGFTVLKSFTGQGDGYFPSGSLTLSAPTLFGATAGIGGTGTVFKINTDGTGFTVLHAFNTTDGLWPNGGLVLSGTTLYGTASAGGPNNEGTIFKMNTDGSGFSILYAFPAGSSSKSINTNAAGEWPQGGLILADSSLYGIAQGGGAFGQGTVFRINTDGSGFTVLHNFAGPPLDGSSPNGFLALFGNALYGTTYAGGSSGNGPDDTCGTIFRLDIDGNRYSVLKQFNGSDGRWPQAGLAMSGATLYGTTTSGGLFDDGVVFSMSLLPCISTPPQSQTVESGGNTYVKVGADGDPVMAFMWYFNGNDFIGCTSNSWLELTNVQPSEIGTYTVIVTNAFGAVTSSPAMLNVIAQVPRRLTPCVNVTGDIGSSVSVEYTDNLGPSANWLPLGTMTLTNPPQNCMDISTPLPPQRFYRAWQTGTPAVLPSLSLPFMVPTITLAGNVEDTLELDYINQFGPTNAWMPLATLTLTNTSELYFDLSAPGQPPRLYRIVPSSGNRM